MTNTWIYICDPPMTSKDPPEGFLYIAKADPEKAVRDPFKMWGYLEHNVWWFEVDRETLRIKHDDKAIDLNNKVCLRDLADALLMDLNDVPIPTINDKYPVVIIQKIDYSQTYYTEE